MRGVEVAAVVDVEVRGLEAVGVIDCGVARTVGEVDVDEIRASDVRGGLVLVELGQEGARIAGVVGACVASASAAAGAGLEGYTEAVG